MYWRTLKENVQDDHNEHLGAIGIPVDNIKSLFDSLVDPTLKITRFKEHITHFSLNFYVTF